VRVKRKFTTLTFVLSHLKEGEGALEGGEARRKDKKDCRNRVNLSATCLRRRWSDLTRPSQRRSAAT